ncbi:MAG: hypothetical protein ACYC1D_18870 [Acidimicrobiales bacterium]
MTAGPRLRSGRSAALTGLSPTSSYLRFLALVAGLGIGMEFLTAAVVAAARAVPAGPAGLASGVNNTARQAAGAMAIAVHGAIAAVPPTRPRSPASATLTAPAAASSGWPPSRSPGRPSALLNSRSTRYPGVR